jgi:hypothetical protein
VNSDAGSATRKTSLAARASTTSSRPLPIATALLARSDPQELGLFAELERTLPGEPPPEVLALLVAYRRGADHAELVRRVQEEFPPELGLRVATLRWIDRARPGAAQGSAATPPRIGSGTDRPWLAPLGAHRR